MHVYFSVILFNSRLAADATSGQKITALQAVTISADWHLFFGLIHNHNMCVYIYTVYIYLFIYDCI